MRPNDGILITRDVTGAIKQLAAVSISLRHPETRARATHEFAAAGLVSTARPFKSLNLSLAYESGETV